MSKFIELVKIMKCSTFLPQYCGIPYTAATRNKLNGKNQRGNPSDFRAEQKKAMLDGARRWLSELESELNAAE